MIGRRNRSERSFAKPALKYVKRNAENMRLKNNPAKLP
jgi:hypothetical protein